jgi:hypothetical protein
VTSPSNYKADDDSGGCDNKGKGEDSNTRGNRQVIFYNLEVEEYIVEERLDD